MDKRGRDKRKSCGDNAAIEDVGSGGIIRYGSAFTPRRIFALLILGILMMSYVPAASAQITGPLPGGAVAAPWFAKWPIGSQIWAAQQAKQANIERRAAEKAAYDTVNRMTEALIEKRRTDPNLEYPQETRDLAKELTKAMREGAPVLGIQQLTDQLSRAEVSGGLQTKPAEVQIPPSDNEFVIDRGKIPSELENKYSNIREFFSLCDVNVRCTCSGAGCIIQGINTKTGEIMPEALGYFPGELTAMELDYNIIDALQNLGIRGAACLYLPCSSEERAKARAELTAKLEAKAIEDMDAALARGDINAAMAAAKRGGLEQAIKSMDPQIFEDGLRAQEFSNDLIAQIMKDYKSGNFAAVMKSMGNNEVSYEKFTAGGYGFSKGISITAGTAPGPGTAPDAGTFERSGGEVDVAGMLNKAGTDLFAGGLKAASDRFAEILAALGIGPPPEVVGVRVCFSGKNSVNNKCPEDDTPSPNPCVKDRNIDLACKCLNWQTCLATEFVNKKLTRSIAPTQCIAPGPDYLMGKNVDKCPSLENDYKLLLPNGCLGVEITNGGIFSKPECYAVAVNLYQEPKSILPLR